MSLVTGSFHWAQGFKAHPCLPLYKQQNWNSEGNTVTWLCGTADCRCSVSLSRASFPAQCGLTVWQPQPIQQCHLAIFGAAYRAPSSITMVRWGLEDSVIVSGSFFPCSFRGSLSTWQSRCLVWPVSSLLVSSALRSLAREKHSPTCWPLSCHPALPEGHAEAICTELDKRLCPSWETPNPVSRCEIWMAWWCLEPVFPKVCFCTHVAPRVVSGDSGTTIFP